MKHSLFIILLTFYSINLFAQNDSISKPKKIEPKPESEYVSIVSLIANPEKYYGKRVSVTGYISTQFEGTAVYLSREDFDNRIYKNGIFLLIGKVYDHPHFHKEYVTLDGTFVKGNGHMGMYSGMLKDVGYITKRN